jgi:OmpA-OmpF porin, OOP family
MRRPGIFWLGLAAAAGLWLALIEVETPKLEATLSSGAEAIVREKLGPTAKVFASGRDLRIEGLVFDGSPRAETLAALRALPGVKDVADDLAPPPAASPFVWRAAWNGATLELSGATPSPAARAALNAAARKAAPGARIVDNMNYASGAPPGFSESAANLLQALAQSRGGAARLSDRVATLDIKPASKPDQRADEATNERSPASPQQAASRPSPDPAPKPVKKPAEDCNATLARKARAAAIEFEGAVELAPQSEAALKALAAAAKSCPGVALEVVGSGGAPDLSWRRAETVAAVLLAEGVAPYNLDIDGAGDERSPGGVAIQVK